VTAPGGGGRFRAPLVVTAILFSVSLVGVILASTLSTSLSTFYWALGVFAGCGAASVGVQASQAYRAPRRLTLGVGALFLAAGIALFCWNLNGSVRLAGGVLAYLGAGFLVEFARGADNHLRWYRIAGWAALAAGALYIAGEGLALLHGAGFASCWLLILVLCILVLVPVGLNLVSEQALRFIAGRPSRRWRAWWLWALAGAALTAAVIIAVGATSNSWLTCLIVAAAALVLISALVSNTQADIVIALCVIALLSVAPTEVTPPAAATPGAGQLDLLALGDSYMSGEGARTFIQNTDESGGDTCRRAPTAYAVLAAGPGQGFDHVTFLACSGARTFNLISRSDDPGAQVQSGEPGTQVDEVKALGPGYRPKLAIVSLGGNDAGFSTLGQTCIAPGNCDTQRALFEDNLPTVRAALLSAYASIRAALPDTPVLVVPYPQPLADQASCNEMALSKSERTFIRQFVSELNQTIRSAAAQAGFYYLPGMENALAAEHLQLCDPGNGGDPGVNFVSLATVSGLADQRFNPANWLHDSLHPNERGHQAMLAAFDAWVKAHPQPTVIPPASRTRPFIAPAVTPGAAEAPDPPCSMTTSTDSCQAITQDWMLARILDLWPYFLAFLLAFIGLWLISVGLLSRLPRPAPEPEPEPEPGEPAGLSA
jgi:lysophospholipase L1-like esterase